MNKVELIGFIAGMFVAISLFPQVIKSWKTKSTRDVALSWSIINLIGQMLWGIYGVYIDSASLIISDSEPKLGSAKTTSYGYTKKYFSG